MRTSNSDPVQPNRIASLNEAIEFSGNPFFLNAPRWAITVLDAKCMEEDFNRVTVQPTNEKNIVVTKSN